MGARFRKPLACDDASERERDRGREIAVAGAADQRESKRARLPIEELCSVATHLTGLSMRHSLSETRQAQDLGKYRGEGICEPSLPSLSVPKTRNT